MSSGEADYLRTHCTCPRGPDGFSVNCPIAAHATLATELIAKARQSANPCPCRGTVFSPDCPDPKHFAAYKSGIPRVPFGWESESTKQPAELFPGDRKQYPVFTGLLMYFPDACAAVARCSAIANEQHNPGEPMHWDRAKSVGTGDEMVRHAMGGETVDTDGEYHDVKAAWRALERVQRRIERQRGR